MRPGRPAGRSRWWHVVAICASALLAGGCATAGSAPAMPASHRPGTGSSASPTASPRAPRASARADFTVSGSVPVQPNPSQDSHAQAPAACQPKEFRHAESLGKAADLGFASAGLPVATMLLAHFLGGTGTAVHFGAGSQIAREARASRVFRSLNRNIQAAVLSRLRAGTSHIRLPGSVLRTIQFAPPASSQDLYLGFRGTQGLDVRGTGAITGRGYAGRLTYVIRDSYGFPPQDRLLGIGTAMRYLQTDCGNPPAQGGAHWFPDSITVTVPFRHPKG
jgi:hypothetical protein